MAKKAPRATKKLGGARVGEGGPRQAKVDAVTQVREKAAAAGAVLLTEYRGLTVRELADLRADLRQADAEYKVYKNTLSSIAVSEGDLQPLAKFFEGPTAFTFANGDPVLAAKKLAEFAKKVPALVLKGGFLDGKVLERADVEALGKLESREVLLTKAAGLLKAGLQNAANLFSAGFNNLGAVLAQLRDKLPPEAPPAAETPAPAAETPAPAEEQPPAPEAPAPEEPTDQE